MEITRFAVVWNMGGRDCRFGIFLNCFLSLDLIYSLHMETHA